MENINIQCFYYLLIYSCIVLLRNYFSILFARDIGTSVYLLFCRHWTEMFLRSTRACTCALFYDV